MLNKRIGIIGYRNHSKKIINELLKKNFDIFVFCYKDSKISAEVLNKENKFNKITYTADIKKLFLCKLIFISSPSKSHVKYIKLFASSNRYIFSEKPPAVNINEIMYLESLKNSIKKKIYFNFNYLHSDIYNNLSNLLFHKKHGKLINISINASHGLFFKKSSINDWRLEQKNVFDNILGNLGIHYVNILINLFGNIKNKYSKFSSNAKKNKLDTYLGVFETKKNVTISIFLSYASMHSQEMKFFFTNSIIEYSNKKLIEYNPRDYFDQNGSFIRPPKKLISNNLDLSKKSLSNSINYFINITNKNKNFSLKNYNDAINSVKVILSSKS